MNLHSDISQVINEADAFLSNPEKMNRFSMTCGTFFLDDGSVLALPRDQGDSRYPYGQEGFNFWVHASGYMYGNEGLFSYLLRSSEGQEPKVAFFASFPKGSDGWQPLSLLSVPEIPTEGLGPVRRYSVLKPMAAYFVTECQKLRFGLRVFVTSDRRICFSLLLENTADQKKRLSVSSFFNPYFRHQIYESGEDRWFKEIRILPSEKQGKLDSFLIQVNEDEDRHTSISNYAVLRRSFSGGTSNRVVCQEATPSRDRYVGGVRSSLHTPLSLYRGTFGEAQPVCTFVENAVAADLTQLDLGPRGKVVFDWVLERGVDEAAIHRLHQEGLDPRSLDRELESIRTQEAKSRQGLSLCVHESRHAEIKPEVFNAFFEQLKKQVEFCSLIKGYIQLSLNSLIGIRDVFQALEGFLFWQPELSKKKMVEALGFTSPHGRCFRQYSLPSERGEVGRMDLRPFIDQGVWVISTVATYLRFTGDLKFLSQKCGYHEILDESSRKVVPSPLKDSVLDHLLKIMGYLLKNRDPVTGCVCALYGDWNDALDGLGISKNPAKAYGTGVSVMVTLQVYQNLLEMIEILERVDASKYAKSIKAYRKALQEIEAGLRRHAVVENKKGGRKIVHGWGDRRSYLVGGFKDPDGRSRDGLTSNAFWVLSGLYEKDLEFRNVILNSFDRLDSKYGLKTFEPAFPPHTKGVGRIGKLPPGTAENGATYVHATAFGIMALFRMGCAEKAWEQLVKILPFTSIHANLSHSTFVMPNSYGYNPEKWIDGQNMNDWQTGSSNVVLKLLIRYVFGFEPTMKGIWIQPATWLPFKSFEFQIRVRNTDLKIRFQDRGGKSRVFDVNGDRYAGVHDPMMNLDKLWVPSEWLSQSALDIRITQG